MPTVGCEADAVAFTEEATTSSGAPATPASAAASAPDGAPSSGDTSVLAVLPDGSYSSGPAAFDAEEASRLRFEACFAAEGLSREGAPAAPSAAGVERYRIKVCMPGGGGLLHTCVLRRRARGRSLHVRPTPNACPPPPARRSRKTWRATGRTAAGASRASSCTGSGARMRA